MDPLSCLPVECLEHIIRCVGNLVPATDSSPASNLEGASSTVTLYQPPLQTPFKTCRLMPLERFSLYDCDIDVLPDIDAIATAFNETLEPLFIKFQADRDSNQTALFGRAWTADLTRLRRFEIHAQGRKLALDPSLLSHYSNLVEVEITDSIHAYTFITQADLFVPGAEEGSTLERIVAPNFWRLYMNGHWSFEDLA
ncbi:hypothetical protein BG015_006518, partial [Linnemannia schmuckeri]